MPALSTQFRFIINTGTFTATSVSIPSTAVSNDGTTLFKSYKEKGDGYYGSGDGNHTVTYTITPNFVGTLTIQATLATDPIELDWFEVDNSKVEYDQVLNPISVTTTNYINFIGNFVWIRGVVQRSSNQPNGSVRFINYNH